jgi:hypothetical protein
LLLHRSYVHAFVSAFAGGFAGSLGMRFRQSRPRANNHHSRHPWARANERRHDHHDNHKTLVELIFVDRCVPTMFIKRPAFAPAFFVFSPPFCIYPAFLYLPRLLYLKVTTPFPYRHGSARPGQLIQHRAAMGGSDQPGHDGLDC